MDDSYKKTLLNLANAGINFLCIGTWALKVMNPQKMANYVLKDCDILVEYNITTIRQIICILSEEHWLIKSWDENIDKLVDETLLEHRYYIRAIKGELTLDITYECSMSWNTLWANRNVYEQLNYIRDEYNLELKRLRGTKTDHEILQLFAY